MFLQLHDNFSAKGMSQGDEIQWPPISFEKFAPSGRGKTLDHYYLSTTGCKKTPLGQVVKWTAIIGGALLAPFTAGASAAAGAAVSTAVAGATAAIGPVLTNLVQTGLNNFANTSIEDMAKGALDDGIEKAKKDAKSSWLSRSNTDSKAEKDRIIRNYNDRKREITTGGMAQKVKTAGLSELKAWKAANQNSINVAQGKCDKNPCDSAGCRWVGSLKLRGAYIDMLIAAMEGANATTVAQYKANTAAAYADAVNKAGQAAVTGQPLPPATNQQRIIERDIVKGRKELNKEKIAGFALPAAIIGAVLLSKIRK
jgi:hypothetical protein